MFGFASGVVGGPLRLEDARFSAEDLMGLNNGYDNMYLTVGKRFFSMDDDELRSSIAKWRKRAATRLAGTGLVDSEGIPSDEFARALRPLSAPGFDITDALYDGHAGLFMCDEGWTVLKKAPGFMGGWSIRIANPEDGIDAVLASALGIAKPEHSQWEGRAYIRYAEINFITDAINDGSEQVLRTIARKRGLPAEGLLDISKAISDAGVRLSKMPRGIKLCACDCSDGVKFKEAGFNLPAVESGYWRTCMTVFVPTKGFYMKEVEAPKPGDDPSILTDSATSDERAACIAGFVKEGSVFGTAMSMPTWYPEDALPPE